MPHAVSERNMVYRCCPDDLMSSSGLSCRATGPMMGERQITKGQMTMRRMTVLMLGAVAALSAMVSAHEVTYSGTVVALQTERYAQPSGGFREVPELEITVVDAKSKKPANHTFTITDTTRLLRAGKAVTLAQAAAQEGEGVEVVFDHDKAADQAIEVRFLTAR